MGLGLAGQGRKGSALMSRRGKSFLSLSGISPSELRELLSFASRLKSEKKERIFPQRLAHRNVALLFEKQSTRTRCSFSVACRDEGAYTDFLGASEIHFGKKESLADTARVLGRFYDGIVYRGYAQATVEALAHFSGVPVFNALTDEEHPSQALADLMTLQEHFAHLAGLRVVYAGDAANNVACSLMQACVLVGAHFVCAAPSSFFPPAKAIDQAYEICRSTGGSVTLEEDPLRAVAGADAIYTDVWVSMGFESSPDVEQKLSALKNYQVNERLMAATGVSHTVFLHCLPANKGFEVSESVFEGNRSLVFEQAENRLHTIKAILVAALSGA
jgi:ornithine carbamoyltransferase